MLKIAVSPLTGKVQAGRLNKKQDAFIFGTTQDVTSDVLCAVVEKAQFHGGAFDIVGGNRKFVVTVIEATATYTTEPGESVMGIALRQLKDENRYKEIIALNTDRFPDMGPHDYYPVGTVLALPARSSAGSSELPPPCAKNSATAASRSESEASTLRADAVGKLGHRGQTMIEGLAQQAGAMFGDVLQAARTEEAKEVQVPVNESALEARVRELEDVLRTALACMEESGSSLPDGFGRNGRLFGWMRDALAGAAAAKGSR